MIVPTSDWYYREQQRQGDYAPSPGAALMPSGEQYGAGQVEPARGAQRSRAAARRQNQAAAQARVIAARAAGESGAAMHLWQSSRPFSQERRARRDEWRRAEAASIEAAYVARAFTFESMYNAFFDLW